LVLDRCFDFHAIKMQYAKRLFKDALGAWWAADPLSSGAAVAFYAVFSIPSLLIIVIASASAFISPVIVRQTIISHMQQVIGLEPTQFVQAIVSDFWQPHAGFWPTIISIFALIISAIGVFTQLEYSLTHLWHVPPEEDYGFIPSVKKYAVAFLLVVCFGVLVAISAMLGLLWSFFGGFLSRFISQSHALISFVTIAELFIIVTIACTIIYIYVPGIRISTKAALIGGITASVLFIIGRELILLYLKVNSSINAYGAASALIVILLWVYYSSQILFFGAALAYAIDKEAKRA
jgi:membrane protein